ncbi:MAG: outer membrane beta-barrel protein [Cytophagales bacterium]
MKFKFLSVLFLIASVQCFSQYEIGGYLMGQMTRVGGSQQSTFTKNLPTYTAGGGILAGIDITNEWDFQTGLIFSRHSQKFVTSPIPTASGEYRGRKRMDYLKIPLTAKYTHFFTQNFAAFGFLGPQLNLLTRAGGAVEIIETDDNGNVIYYDLPQANNKYYNFLTVGGTIGVGSEYQFAHNLYLVGLLKVDFDFNGYESKNVEYNNVKVTENKNINRNSSFALMVGVSYKLRKGSDMYSPSSPIKRRR